MPALPSNILNGLRGPNSTVDLTYTYHMSKYSCVREFYYIHMFMVYVVFIAGILCFLTRLWAPIKFLHPWFGKLYVSGMIIATACSMLIHNEGLPTGVVVSFVVCLFSMCFGYLVIKLHENQMMDKALRLVGEWTRSGKIDPAVYGVEKAIKEAKGVIALSKDAMERVISLKAAHGLLMLMSWFNIAGRIGVTSINPEFTCFSYPGYKPRNATEYNTVGMNLEYQPLQLLPLESPTYGDSPWAYREGTWAIMISLGPISIGVLIGIIYSYAAAAMERDSNSSSLGMSMKDEGADVQMQKK